MKQSLKFIALGLVTLAAACGSKGDVATSPPDTTTTNPPPAPPPPPPPPTPGVQAVVFAAGNISKCSNGNAAATARLIDTSATAVITLGNAANPSGQAADYACFDATWGKFKNIMRSTIGNHDYSVDATGSGYFNYFGAKAGTAPDGWYSYDLGSWHVIVLNTEEGGNSNVYNSTSPQQAWLAADLKAHASAKCMMAVWHRPRFLSSNQAGYTENTTLQSLWSQLDGAGVDVILNAGEYAYERMYPMSTSGARNDSTGIVQFNVGLGGENAGSTFSQMNPNSAHFSVAFGVLKLTLKDSGYDFQYLTIPGSADAGESGTYSCH